MRIALLTTEFATEPSFAGGLAQYLGRLSWALTDRGDDVEVFTLGEHAHTTRTPGGAIVHSVPPADVRLGGHNLFDAAEYYMLRNVLPMWLRTSMAIRGAVALNRQFRVRSRGVRFDIVQASNFRAPALMLQRDPPVPVVVRLSSYAPMLHEWWDAPNSLDNHAVEILEDISLRRAQGLYAPSGFLSARVACATGLTVHRISPPLTFESVSEDSSAVAHVADWPKYLLFFGRLTAYKGAGLLQEAIEPLLQADSAIRLVLAGSVKGEAGRGLVRLADRYPEQVRVLGVLQQSHLAPLLRRAWAVVLPSMVDNLPNTCLEAMAAGAVVIGPDGASFDELVTPGCDGLLFAYGSAESLRRTMLETWAMPQACHDEISNAARNVVTRFDAQSAVSELIDYYRQVIARFRQARADGLSGELGHHDNKAKHHRPRTDHRNPPAAGPDPSCRRGFISRRLRRRRTCRG